MKETAKDEVSLNGKESRLDYMSFSSENEVNQFFQSIFKTHSAVFPRYQTLDWNEWLLVASALNLPLRKV